MVDYMKEEIINYLPLVDFQNLLQRSIIEKLHSVYKEKNILNTSEIEEILSSEEFTEYTRLMMIDTVSVDANQVHNLIRTIRLKSLRNQYKEHSILADQLNRAGDSTFIAELHKCQEIQKLIKEWSK